MEAIESVLRAGYRLDRYELLCPIASGGMATVWLAKLRGKRGFEKLFAIKTIRTELVDDARFQEMFLDEARIASGIQHPNVAQILDLGEQDDVLFIVMEWVDGDSLAKVRRILAKRGSKLPLGIVLRVLADACAGLHAAHELRDERGEPLEVVHRDVSPHNILLSTLGAVKVIDFGIAKAQNRKQGETRTGIVKGKVQYMAPEQVRKGGSVDRRADVWALGMCLHELVTGKLPWDGEDEVGVIRRLMADDAPSIAEDLPPAIGRVLARAIVVDVDARFPTAAGMQRALEGAMKEIGEAASAEDVAGFVRAELPELAVKRREAVGKAIDEARERGTVATPPRDGMSPPSPGRGRDLDGTSPAPPGRGRDLDDVAFAPTLVGEGITRRNGGEEEGRAIALSRRKASAATTSENSLAVAAAQEPIRIPKKSRGWMWATLFVLMSGGGAAAVWPQEALALLAKLGWTQPVPGAIRQVSPAVAARPADGEPARPAGSPTAIATTIQSAASPSAAPSASSSTAAPLPSDQPAAIPAASHGALETSQAHPLPSHEPALPPPVTQVPEAAAPVATVSAPPLPPPAPAEAEDDPNNPYN